MDGGKVDLTADEQGKVLQAFSKAIQREMHNLTQNPGLLWQQLHNRLQWFVEGINKRLRRILTGILDRGIDAERFWLAGISINNNQ